MKELQQPQQPEIFADLAQHVAATLKEMVGMENDIAEQIAVAVANRMMHAWGGQTVYLPKGMIFMTSARDYQIWQECDGRNYRELAKKYNLTLQWIYTVVKKIQRAESARRQLTLFSLIDEPDE
ncbi:Mor transcription activator family protein [Salmonella enterica]|uniref:Mor transcription activator family protein n=1 Tax=Salmonella enterica TaxID=28901 RepID=UPI0021D49DF3|nr:Mor transcription activator family protein [Salmonella enterica]EBA4495604.1 DNA-binding protein [Salmonella enterica]MCU7097885.1 DNA-binding protein [Salmonella enterica]MCU7116290.1 DNA-binding protein [Salmonella enterica]MCU7122998.1 DNA-binding protein [Salmonella enterica]